MTIIIKESRTLNNQQYQLLSQYLRRAHHLDNYPGTIHHQSLLHLPHTPALWLALNEQTIIGFARAFFYHADMIELFVYIAEANRRQHHADLLINAIRETLKPIGIEHAYFCIHPIFTPWAIQNMATPYQTLLQFELPVSHVDKHNVLPNIIQATAHDYSQFMSLDSSCFPEEPPLTPSRFHQLLTSPKYQLLAYKEGSQLLAKLHLSQLSPHTFQISDMAVHPKFRNQGLAKRLLRHAQHTLPVNSKLQLDVDMSNSKAKNLYLSQGFQQVNTIQYWQFKL